MRLLLLELTLKFSLISHWKASCYHFDNLIFTLPKWLNMHCLVWKDHFLFKMQNAPDVMAYVYNPSPQKSEGEDHCWLQTCSHSPKVVIELKICAPIILINLFFLRKNVSLCCQSALNMKSSCMSIPNPGITGPSHHTQLVFWFCALFVFICNFTCHMCNRENVQLIIF